jgi:hypothetical protein
MKIRVLLLTLTLATAAAVARAQGGCVNGPCPVTTPEIDTSLSGTALTLLGGTLLVLRARKQKR